MLNVTFNRIVLKIKFQLPLKFNQFVYKYASMGLGGTCSCDI